MLIDDKSRYITHENNDEERKAAANELGECLKSAMADCYANNTLTKEAYISNIQKYISGASHQLTFEPAMEVKVVDQYGRAWSEVASNQSMKSPLTGDRTLPETQASFWNPLDIGSRVFYEGRQPIPLEYIKDYYKKKMSGIENPSIDILALGKGPLSYEGAKEYIESDPMYLRMLENSSNSLSLPEPNLLESGEETKTASITESSRKISKLDSKGFNMIANMERNKSGIDYDVSTGKIISIPTIGPDVGYGHDITQNPMKSIPNSLSASEALKLLKEDVEEIEKKINDDINANFTQNQFNALVSLRYNIGGLGEINGFIEYLEKGIYDRQEMESIINAYYNERIEENPKKEQNRQGWYNRTKKFLDVFFDSNYGNMPIDAVNGKVDS